MLLFLLLESFWKVCELICFVSFTYYLPNASILVKYGTTFKVLLSSNNWNVPYRKSDRKRLNNISDRSLLVIIISHWRTGTSTFCRILLYFHRYLRIINLICFQEAEKEEIKDGITMTMDKKKGKRKKKRKRKTDDHNDSEEEKVSWKMTIFF